MVELTRRLPQQARPDLTPLLDVVFILLIFFVVSAVFTARGMNVDLPEAESSRPVSGRSLEIDLAADGGIRCAGESTTLRELGYTLRTMAEDRTNPRPARILLRAAPDAHTGLFVSVMDLVRLNGFENLVIATREPAGVGDRAQ
ncbi:biopolymer transport protein ExbD [Desulfobaculum xiamenense]|uniref:Biopolymer transport protein ExbD n=1 Tax=Desulfobaculum xiamenense TaxID=995050 RepID=A0A846QM16_9BACT|nr:biopolymer transporter ExbD [Desulfobaculum xiamenense]NJB66475.1 biopolymer transport protein ExbD [Desulfobaculum xiamenense]